MSAPLELQDGLLTDYYAPGYQILVDGQELHPETKGDVLDLKVVMDLDNMTSFDFTVSNWDDKQLRFKYSEGGVLDIGHTVEVKMGYADRMLSMVVGQISTITPRFPESGSLTMGVSGQDGMLKLRDRKPTGSDKRVYRDMADWQIAEDVARRNKLDVVTTKEGPQHGIVVQKNQDDASFLMERAKRIDFDCYIVTDPARGKGVLHFVKPTDGREGTRARVYQLEWGKSLINFTPTLTISNQVSEVCVQGWDPRTKSVIKYSAKRSDLPSGKGTTGPAAADQHLGGKKEVVVDAPVASEQEARELAKSLLAERAYEFITGSGRMIGLPDLRPGENLELQGLGERFSGTYYVKKITHTIGQSGYQTDFEARRVHDGKKP